jgi:hypothetical protein
MEWFQKYIDGERLLWSRSSTMKLAITLLNNKATNFIETGTTRKNYINCPKKGDRAGDGCATVLFAEYSKLFGGHVWTCDISEENINNCKIATEEYKDVITYVVNDSLDFLINFKDKIDFLYLDSVDGGDPTANQHQLKEIMIALPKLHQNSIVLLDDLGSKTEMSIPFLRDNGWCQIVIENTPAENPMCQALFVNQKSLFIK